MTPTLAQLKKRPALWFLVTTDETEPRITMPDGALWFYSNGWRCHQGHFHANTLENYEFGGWL